MSIVIILIRSVISMRKPKQESLIRDPFMTGAGNLSTVFPAKTRHVSEPYQNPFS